MILWLFSDTNKLTGSLFVRLHKPFMTIDIRLYFVYKGFFQQGSVLTLTEVKRPPSKQKQPDDCWNNEHYWLEVWGRPEKIYYYFKKMLQILKTNATDWFSRFQRDISGLSSAHWHSLCIDHDKRKVSSSTAHPRIPSAIHITGNFFKQDNDPNQVANECPELSAA